MGGKSIHTSNTKINKSTHLLIEDNREYELNNNIKFVIIQSMINHLIPLPPTLQIALEVL